MKTYEITYVTPHEETADAKMVTPILSQHKASIISVHPWGGRRRLAYPIKKQDQAFYTTAVFEADPAAIVPIQRALNLENDILRTLILEFEPGMFHRTTPTEEVATTQPKPQEKATSEEAKPAAEIQVEAAATEPAIEASEEAPKPRRTKKVKEDEKTLDEKLDALLSEDITK